MSQNKYLQSKIHFNVLDNELGHLGMIIINILIFITKIFLTYHNLNDC